MRRGLSRLLNARGFATEEFASAEAFLDRAPLSRPACVVLDIHLGGMSGIDLKSRLQASGVDLPVIFITAIDDQELEREATGAGCFAYLHKPFAAELLIDAVKRSLAGSHSE